MFDCRDNSGVGGRPHEADGCEEGGSYKAVSPLGSTTGAMVYFAVAGPSVSVMVPSTPQSTDSVAGSHIMAYVVAVASWHC